MWFTICGGSTGILPARRSIGLWFSFDWAEDFDSMVRQTMTTRPQELMNLMRHPSYALAVPTPEHFLPLAYLAGLSTAAEQPVDVLVEGGTMGAITMTSFVLGCAAIRKPGSAQPAAALPDPSEVPPQDTNT